MWLLKKPAEPPPGSWCAVHGHDFTPRFTSVLPPADPECRNCPIRASETKGY